MEVVGFAAKIGLDIGSKCCSVGSAACVGADVLHVAEIVRCRRCAGGYDGRRFGVTASRVVAP